MLKLTAHVHSWVLEAADALRRREEGQTMAEYGVILAVLTVGVVAALIAFSGAIQDAFQVVNDTISAVL